MPRGGPRPGAGRPAKAIKYAGPVTAAEQQIIDKLPQLVEAQMKLALGQVITVEDKINLATGDITQEIYAVAPDAKAGQYLIDRILGKPTTMIDADVAVDAPGMAAELDEDTRARVRAALLQTPIRVAPTGD